MLSDMHQGSCSLQGRLHDYTRSCLLDLTQLQDVTLVSGLSIGVAATPLTIETV